MATTALPFAQAIADMVGAVTTMLANVTATINGVETPAIFANASTLATVGAYGMSSTQPMLTLATADVPASPTGKAVTVNSINYLIAEHEPDGTGISRLLLERA